MTDLEILRLFTENGSVRLAIIELVKQAVREALEDERRAARGEREVRHFGEVPL